MLQRGIRNVFHASLLRIHKPNDDWLFPGRLDSQIVGIDDGEWAADRIVAHRGRTTSAMFEVLWKAGNKTWMSYEQVNELNLLEPYLELVGIETISELIDGNGEPPHDDPQIYLGHLKSTHNISDEEGAQPVPSSSNIPPPITTLSLCGINYPTMSGSNNNGRPERHPFVTIDHNSKIMRMLVNYDVAAHNANGDTQAMPTAPAGYNTIASLLNSAPQCPYHFAEFDRIERKYVNLDRPFPDNYFPTTFIDPQLDILVMFGFISKEGIVDRQAVKDSSAREQSHVQLPAPPAPPTAKKRYRRAADHGSGEEEMGPSLYYPPSPPRAADHGSEEEIGPSLPKPPSLPPRDRDSQSTHDRAASPPDKDQLSKRLQSLKGNSPPALAAHISDGMPKPFTKDAIPTASKSVNTKVQDLKGKQKESITMEELEKEA
ncbi:hypothetical protein DXG01_007104 [Tephrocybe rancida]|nr:hypothetical protein DXG01_007104 [Tephrocybe rancida]